MKLLDPDTLPRGPRRFLAYYIRDIAHGHDKRGAWSLIPIKFGVCAAVGAVVGRWANDEIWTNQGDAIAFYGAGLAVSAILLAVCWAAFGKIFETLADPEFGAWLSEKKLSGYYGFYIDFIQLSQMIGVAGMGAGLILALISDLPTIVQRITLGGAVTLSLYAATWTTGCVRVMQELSDHRSSFRLRSKADNVEVLPQRGRSPAW